MGQVKSDATAGTRGEPTMPHAASNYRQAFFDIHTQTHNALVPQHTTKNLSESLDNRYLVLLFMHKCT